MTWLAILRHMYNSLVIPGKVNFPLKLWLSESYITTSLWDFLLAHLFGVRSNFSTFAVIQCLVQLFFFCLHLLLCKDQIRAHQVHKFELVFLTPALLASSSVHTCRWLDVDRSILLSSCDPAGGPTHPALLC